VYPVWRLSGNWLAGGFLVDRRRWLSHPPRSRAGKREGPPSGPSVCLSLSDTRTGTDNLPGRSPVKVRATRWEEPTYRIRSYGPGLHVPMPESRKVSPAIGMNSHVYDPSDSVNFSTPCTLALRTSLFGCTVPIP
jgi:hypothetical protein